MTNRRTLSMVDGSCKGGGQGLRGKGLLEGVRVEGLGGRERGGSLTNDRRGVRAWKGHGVADWPGSVEFRN